MPVSGRAGRSSTREYQVAGSSLAEINRAIERAGPRDPNDGTRYSGSCICTLRVAIAARDIAFQPRAGGSPLEVAATFGGGNVFADCVLTLPRLRSATGLSAAAQREWTRFAAAVRTHEQGHVASYVETAVELAGELNALSATGHGANERAAHASAARALLQLATQRIGGSVLRTRANASARDYDAHNRHGRSQGAVLDTAIA
jgi:predicted secreted Zn-dependent protease